MEYMVQQNIYRFISNEFQGYFSFIYQIFFFLLALFILTIIHQNLLSKIIFSFSLFSNYFILSYIQNLYDVQMEFQHIQDHFLLDYAVDFYVNILYIQDYRNVMEIQMVICLFDFDYYLYFVFAIIIFYYYFK